MGSNLKEKLRTGVIVSALTIASLGIIGACAVLVGLKNEYKASKLRLGITQRYDLDGSEVFEPNEVLKAYSKLQQDHLAKKIKHEFRVYDRDDNGILDVNEMSRLESDWGG